MRLFALRRRLYSLAEKRLLALRITLLRLRQIPGSSGNELQWIGLPRLLLTRHTNLIIGARCIFRSEAGANPIGFDQPVTFCDLTAGAFIAFANTAILLGRSVVIRDIPAKAAAAGNPCKVREQWLRSNDE